MWRRACRWSLAGLLITGMGCRSSRPGGPTGDGMPMLHVEDVLAPGTGSASLQVRELKRALSRDDLSRDRRHAIELRLAALQIGLGDLDDAERSIASVVDSGTPSPKAEAIGWFLRHRVLRARGDLAAASQALARAEQLATEPDLRARVAAAMAPVVVAKRPSPQQPTASTMVPALVKRQDWLPEPAVPRRMVPMGQPERITVHHSAMFLVDSAAEAERQMRAVQRQHVEQRGWGDIGYHYLVDRNGRILEGRDLRWQGAHAGNDTSNRHNIGICLLGNFQPGRERAQRPTTPQVQALEALLRALCKGYDIPVRRIFTHYEIHPQGRGATECPGAALQPIVDTLRRKLRQGEAALTRAGE